MRILIADSGATKTEWVLLENGNREKTIHTQGISPYYSDTPELQEILKKELLPDLGNPEIGEIFFYGTGCSTEKRIKIVFDAIQPLFPGSTLHVNHDMLAAARAVCGKQKGIAVIIGTGSNACLFDGKDITQSLISPGFMLGDEGSGAYIGKLFMTDYLYGDLPPALDKTFTDHVRISRNEIIDNIYKADYPSRYLASFVPFIHEHKADPHIQKILDVAFNGLIDRQVSKLEGYRELTIHFCGSAGYYFNQEVVRVFENRGLKTGRFLKDPMEGLVAYHS